MTKINIGKFKVRKIDKILDKPKKKYRIIIQERLAVGNDIESCRSFTIHDYSARSTIDSIKRKLIKTFKGVKI